MQNHKFDTEEYVWVKVNSAFYKTKITVIKIEGESVKYKINIPEYSLPMIDEQFLFETKEECEKFDTSC